MARLKGLEPLTRSLEGCRSNPLSYRRSDFQTIREVPELLTLLSKYCESRTRELAPEPNDITALSYLSSLGSGGAGSNRWGHEAHRREGSCPQ
jgi:hypothetical protein